MKIKKFKKYSCYITQHEEYRRGYADTFTIYTQTFRARHFVHIFGMNIKFKTEILFVEEVPNHAIYARACTGDSGWNSGCPSDIFNKCDQQLIEFY